MREAGDVKNPLCWDNGATYVYGPQNGASEEALNTLERGMRNYRDVLTEGFGGDEGAERRKALRIKEKASRQTPVS